MRTHDRLHSLHTPIHPLLFTGPASNAQLAGDTFSNTWKCYCYCSYWSELRIARQNEGESDSLGPEFPSQEVLYRYCLNKCDNTFTQDTSLTKLLIFQSSITAIHITSPMKVNKVIKNQIVTKRIRYGFERFANRTINNSFNNKQKREYIREGFRYRFWFQWICNEMDIQHITSIVKEEGFIYCARF